MRQQYTLITVRHWNYNSFILFLSYLKDTAHYVDNLQELLINAMRIFNGILKDGFALSFVHVPLL